MELITLVMITNHNYIKINLLIKMIIEILLC